MERDSSRGRSLKLAGSGTLIAVVAIAVLMAVPVSAGQSALGPTALASGVVTAKTPGAHAPQFAATLGVNAHPNVVVRASLGNPATTPSCLPTQMCPALLLTGYDMGTYGVDGVVGTSSSFNGTGQAIGIFDACGDPNIASDLATFDAAWGVPTSSAPLTVYTPDGTPCTNSGWELETALDVEWAHAVAPGAPIDLFETATSSNLDFYNAWNYGWNNTPAYVFSNSWSAGANCFGGLNDEAEWISNHGGTILSATGDSGSWGWDTAKAYNTPAQPADCPRVTSVGGTTLNVDSSGNFISETAWNSGGGGYGGYTEPAWQAHAFINNPSPGYIGSPDVAADANGSTGVLVYDSGNGGWFIVGGTSVATPLWSAFLTDVNSWRINVLGFPHVSQINPYLFQTVYGAFARGADYPVGMHDIVTGCNGHGGNICLHWPAGPGWDPDTGLGSFNGYNLDYILSSDYSA